MVLVARKLLSTVIIISYMVYNVVGAEKPSSDIDSAKKDGA